MWHIIGKQNEPQGTLDFEKRFVNQVITLIYYRIRIMNITR